MNKRPGHLFKNRGSRGGAYSRGALNRGGAYKKIQDFYYPYMNFPSIVTDRQANLKHSGRLEMKLVENSAICNRKKAILPKAIEKKLL